MKSPTTNLVDDLWSETPNWGLKLEHLRCSESSVGDRRSQPCSPIGAAEDKFGQSIIDIGTPLPDLCDSNGELILTDLTKYAYRKKVQELLYLSSSAKYDDKPSEIEMRDVFSKIRQYMLDNKMMDDPLLKLLSEDLYIAIKTMDLGEEKSCMYAAARQTSQGRQRSYNVGSSIPETMNYDNIPRLVRGTNDPYDFRNFTLERSTTTCFASPTMISTFSELQGQSSLPAEDITTPTGSQSPISQDFEC